MMRRFLLLWAPIALLACGPKNEDCTRLNDAAADCFGPQFDPIDCQLLGPADITNLAEGLETLSCAERPWVLPVDGDPEASLCRLTGVACVESFAAIPKSMPTRWPVVFVNGFDTSILFQWSPRILEAAEEQTVAPVGSAINPPYTSPAIRAVALAQTIRDVVANTGTEKVNLVCHSLGGLDCRYLVSPNGLRLDDPERFGTIFENVASVTTVGTAHRGTPVADLLIGLAPTDRQDAIISPLVSAIGDAFRPGDLEVQSDLLAAMTAISTDAMAQFNRRIVDEDSVRYRSYGGFAAPYGRARPGEVDALQLQCEASNGAVQIFGAPGQNDYLALPLLGAAEALYETDALDPPMPNDGLVPLDSTRWGAFMGCIAADHMEQLGQYKLPTVNVRTGIDIAVFYRHVMRALAEDGL